MLPSNTIKMIKKKIKFKKRITTPKIPCLNKYIQRAIEKDLQKAQIPNLYTVTVPEPTTATIPSQSEGSRRFYDTKKLFIPIHLLAAIESFSKTYIITPRRLKKKLKRGSILRNY